jgi:hypothetical protein
VLGGVCMLCRIFAVILHKDKYFGVDIHCQTDNLGLTHNFLRDLAQKGHD